LKKNRPKINLIYSLGIDIGTVNIQAVLLQRKGKTYRILRKQSFKTPDDGNSALEQLKILIEELSLKIPSKNRPANIGVAMAGILNSPEKGFFIPPSLSWLRSQKIKKFLEENFTARVKVEDDGNCFVLGESIFNPEAKNKKLIAGLTLGAGVKGGIIMKNKIFRGAFGLAGNFGHVSINTGGPECSCGRQGCLEVYASDRFIRRKTASSAEVLKGKAKKGDKAAQEIFKQMGQFLGQGLTNIINSIDPDVIVIGGGLANSAEFFLDEAKRVVRESVLSIISANKVKITTAALGEFAGAVGAALLF